MGMVWDTGLQSTWERGREMADFCLTKVKGEFPYVYDPREWHPPFSLKFTR